MASSAASLADGLRMTLELFETGIELMRQNLRRIHSDAGPEEIEQRLGKWLVDRPGAKWGDCAGSRVDVGSRGA